MSEKSSGEAHLPEQRLALASAMAHRQIKEKLWQHSVLGQFVPQDPLPPTEVVMSVQTGSAVLMLESLESLESPNTLRDPVERLSNVIDDTVIFNVLRSNNQDPTEDDIKEGRELINSQLTLVWDHFMSDVDAQEDFKNHIDAAHAVAAEYSVDVCDVFYSDDLYDALIRSSHTPESFTQDVIASLSRVDLEFMLSLLENTITVSLQAEFARGEITADEMAELIQLYKQDMLTDEDFIANMKAGFIAQNYATKQLAIRSVERYWGAEAVPVAEQLLGTIAVSSAAQIDHDSVFQSRIQRNDVFVTECIAHGWDPNSLTVEQTRQINSKVEDILSDEF